MIVTMIAAIAMAGACDRARAFDPPTACEVQQEQESCNASRLCRAVIGYRPADMEAALIGAPSNCLTHAEHIQTKLGRGEIVFGSVRGKRHAVLIADGWVIDNGALSPLRIFPASELPRLWAQ